MAGRWGSITKGKAAALTTAFLAMALLAPLERSSRGAPPVGLAEAKGELQNTWTYMSPACKTNYYDIITTYYYRQAVCKYLLFAAFNSTDPSNCPSTIPGSDVWQCLRGGSSNNTAVYNVWWNFIGSCDLLWVAFRAPLAEGEGTTPSTVTGEGESSSNTTSEEYAILSHEAYENGGVEVEEPVIPNYGAGEGESGRRRSLKASSSSSSDEGESAEFDGLYSYDNSCFMRFDSMEQLGEYLTADPLVWNAAAGSLLSRTAPLLLWTLAAAAALMAALLLDC